MQLRICAVLDARSNCADRVGNYRKYQCCGAAADGTANLAGAGAGIYVAALGPGI
jgi:hypothetical protein